MPTEQEAIANLTEGEDRWLQLWSMHVSTLDQKANIIVTLDGILLALTASFLGTALSRSIPLIPSVLFGVSTGFSFSSLQGLALELRGCASSLQQLSRKQGL